MVYRLINQRNPAQTLTLTRGAWYCLLDMARQSGWNPMGTIHQGFLHGLVTDLLEYYPLGEGEPGNGTYTPVSSRLVMLEDALNLMDALERAFIAYEPQPVASYYGIFRTEWDELRDRTSPGIGSLQALTDFCRAGPFIIEGREHPLSVPANGGAATPQD